MKPNDQYRWTITLYSPSSTKPRADDSTEPVKPMDVSQITHVGDVQSVLGAADEQEDQVDFEVGQFVITRGEKA